MADTFDSSDAFKQKATEHSAYNDFKEVASSGCYVLMKARKFGRWFLMKGLKEEYRGKEPYESLLKQEFELGRRLEHPNIIEYQYLKEIPGYGNMILMDNIIGCPLDQYLTTHPDLPSKIRIVEQLCAGLEYLRRHQVVLDQLNTADVFIPELGGNVKIIDLGVAAHAEEQVATGEVAADAASPAKGKVKADATRSDIYALGKVLEEMDFPRKYNEVIEKCCESDSHDRYPDFDSFLNAFHQADKRQTVAYWLVPLVIVAIFVVIFAVSHLKGNGSAEPAASTTTEQAENPDSIQQAATQPKTQPQDNQEQVAASSDTIPVDIDQLSAEGYQGINAIFKPYERTALRGVSSELFAKMVKEVNERSERYMEDFLINQHPMDAANRKVIYQRFLGYTKEKVRKMSQSVVIKDQPEQAPQP